MTSRIFGVFREWDLLRGQDFRGEALLSVLLHSVVILGQGLILLGLFGCVSAVPPV